MAYSHDEIVENMVEEIEALTEAMKARVQCKKHLEEDDDDYLFIEKVLDRWGDLKVPH
jgi:hypothetical protein